MWYEKDSVVIDAQLLEGIETDLIFNHKYVQPITPSKRQFKRDFIVERKRSFTISGIEYHSYRTDLWISYNYHGTDYYNGFPLDLEFEPWNEYDPNAIVIKMSGRVLGYIGRYDTDEVGDIMTHSKCYCASLDCSCMGFERVDITSLWEFHDSYSLPYQTDLILSTTCSTEQYKKYLDFIKRNIGHTVTFWESYEKRVAICTDMESVIGYIDDTFIANQYWKTPIAGFIEDVVSDENSKKLEIKLRLLMEKSVINKNYLNSYKALEKYFGSFYDAGTYCISLENLIKVVPRKSRSLSAYEPLIKYLKEYHAITLRIEE